MQVLVRVPVLAARGGAAGPPLLRRPPPLSGSRGVVLQATKTKERTVCVRVREEVLQAEGDVALFAAVARESGVPVAHIRLVGGPRGRELRPLRSRTTTRALRDGDTLTLLLRLAGGIDYQHREGSKFGGGGLLSGSQAEIARKERLKKLAMETSDLSKDPYFVRNRVGKIECRLCLTVHNNEGNYLIHTQGKRHQSNLARRAAMDDHRTKLAELRAGYRRGGVSSSSSSSSSSAVSDGAGGSASTPTKTLRIGRPGYRVSKSRDLQTNQRSLTFELDFPDAAEGYQPRHRFMSTYEQRKEAHDRNYQYLLFACEPYETVAFKIPAVPIDRAEGRFRTDWDRRTKKFVLQLFFLEPEQLEEMRKQQEAARRGGAPRQELRYTGSAV